MLRVLIISQGYPPLDGGVATSTQRIARQFAEAGVEVMVFTFAYARSSTVADYILAEQDGSIPIRRIGPFHRHHDIDENELSVVRRRAYDQMERLALEWQPTAILSFYASNAGLLGTYLATTLGVPNILCLRGNDIGRNIFSTTWLPVLDLMLRRAWHVACVNDHLMARLTTAFPESGAKASVVRNSVALPPINVVRDAGYVRTRIGWPDDASIAVFIGTPREKKGISPLLHAVAAASQEAALRLLVVGPELKEGERKICGSVWDKLREAGILHCTGQLDRAAALAIAGEGDMVVMPSIEDGLANGLLEGMALGLCPIASSIFGDVITHNVEGLLVPVGDHVALAEALVHGARNPALRRSLGAAAKRVTDCSFAPERERREYLQLLKDATAQPSDAVVPPRVVFKRRSAEAPPSGALSSPQNQQGNSALV